MQPIVARPRPILVFADPSSADLSSAGRVFAGLSSAGPILAARFIVSPAFARLRFVRPIFGSHVSKDYSRKSRFDKSSKHFFREKFPSSRPHPSGAECKPVTSAPSAPCSRSARGPRPGTLTDPYLPATGPQSGPISGTIRGNTVTFSFTYPTNVQGKRTYTGTISRQGAVSGSWSQTGTQVPNNGTWSLGTKANHACPRFWWWNPRHVCFVRGH